jgi:hypothetical protein
VGISAFDALNEGCADDGSPGTLLFLIADCDATHNVALYVDGQQYTPFVKYLDGDGPFLEDFTIPNDGITHTLQFVDDGTRGTPKAKSETKTFKSDCEGDVMASVAAVTQNVVTRETYVDIQIEGNGKARVSLDGNVVSPELSVPAGTAQPFRVTLQPDGARHPIKVEMQGFFGDDWLTDHPVGWFVEQAADPGGPVTGPPTQDAVDYFPGDTVIIQSAEGTSPIANDGTEWVLVDYAPQGTPGGWIPVGEENGLITPDEDGSWSASLETDPDNFPVGSKWNIRARHFRNYQESAGYVAPFNMVSGSPSGGGLPTPVITGPLDHTQRGSTWMELRGTGIPGARVEFTVEQLSGWGVQRDIYVPERTTVGRNGRWRTWVYGEARRDPFPFKVVAYRARVRRNGRFSNWSEPLEVTWQYPLR